MSTPVVDAHMHFWNVEDKDWYPALKPFAEQVQKESLYSNFLLSDYTDAAQGLDVQGLVHVSATTAKRSYLDEGRWIDSLASENKLNLVQIGTVDPQLSHEEIVNDLEEQATSDRFRGVRVFPGLDPDDPAGAAILNWLSEHDMVFDLVTQPEAMDRWVAKLKNYPGLSVVLEHTGWPSDVGDDGFRVWQQGMSTLARETDLSCKITGLAMATMSLSEGVLRPWIEGAIDAFGWDRVIFGSNMPIESIGGTFADWIQTVDAVVSSASETEKENFYVSNAMRLYRL